MARHLLREGGSDAEAYYKMVPTMSARDLVELYDYIHEHSPQARVAVNGLRGVCAMRFFSHTQSGEHDIAHDYSLAYSVITHRQQESRQPSSDLL